MAFTDWDSFSSANNSYQLDVITPIIGSGSLSNNYGGGAAEGGNIHLNAGFSRGFTSGRIRTLVSSANGLQLRYGFAIVFMAEQLDMVTNAGDFYAFTWVYADQGGGESNFNLQKVTNSTIVAFDPRPSSSDVLMSSNTFDLLIAQDEVIPMQVQWNLDQVQLGGIQITCSVGNAGDLDFANLAVVYDVVDLSPFTTTVQEGLATEKSGSVSGLSFRADQTQVAQLT